MIRNYFTLRKLVDEFSILRNCKIIECFSQDKNNVIFNLYDGTSSYYLNFNTDSNTSAIYIKSNYNRARFNTVDLFDEILGQSVNDIALWENDRIVEWKLNDYVIRFLVFGGAKSNVLITDKNNIVVSAFKRQEETAGRLFVLNSAKMTDNNEQISIFEYVRTCHFYFSQEYTMEFIKRYEIHAELNWCDLSELNKKEILTSVTNFVAEINNSLKCFILRSRNSDYLFSLISLSEYEIVEVFDSVNKAIERRIRKEYIETGISKLRKILLSRLKTQKAKAERTIAEIKDSESKLKKAALYRKWGELLLAYPYQKEKFGNSINLNDWDGNKHEIPLVASKTIIENAERYFEKSKSSEKNITIRTAMLPAIIDKLNRIDKLIECVEEADSLKKLTKIEKENVDLFGLDEGNPEVTSRFRTFDLGEGFTLYVGKNAANNDELTMRFARPYDLWFHARGTSGSHAILRLNKDAKIPKYILQKAAGIAAYYSGAKKAKYVPVSYTYKKYVNKPKGANPGSVTISRESVIMVEPKIE